MRRMGTLLAVAALALSACGSDGKTASSTSTSQSSSASSTTTTIATTSTTLDPEAAVKTAYLAYWSMVDRLTATPNTNDPEITARTTEPLTGFLMDDLGTSAAKGNTQSTPPGRTSSHRIDAIKVDGTNATVQDCYVDARVVYGPAGETLDDAIVSKTANVTLLLVGNTWKVSDVVFGEKSAGADRCAA